MPALASSRIYLRLFGSPLMLADGDVINIGRRARALVGYLAMINPPRATRERLVGLFWPDRGETQSRASLRQCLAELRSVLGDVVVADRESVALDIDGLAGDLWALEAAMARDEPGVLTEAIAAIGAEPLLDGMEFGEAFDDWLRGCRAAHDARLAKAVLLQMRASSAAEQPALALALADAWLVRDPLDEAVAAAAIAIEMAQNAAVAARKRFRTFELALAREGEGPPGPVLRAALDTPPRAVAVAAPAMAMVPAAPVAPAARTRANLLAVLPFDNLSNDPDLSYFSDGVSEEILYTVARAKGLRVVGKASSFQFRGRDKTARTVAEALGATHMLDGSVRRAGNDIRINSELVDTNSLEMLWTDRYDRALTDIFALQDEIAAAIAAALDHHFAPARAAIPVDPAAYDLYLRARAIYAQDLTWADQAKCVALLEGAVARAPDFAQAWGRLAVYLKGEAAIVAARRGLELDPNCAPALAAMAISKPSFAQHGEKLELAERAYLLTPDDQLVAGVYTVVQTSLGLLTRACEVSIARFERDPLSPLVAGGLAIVYRSAGLITEAAAIADRAIADFPESEYIKFIRGVIAIFDGDIDRAAAIVAAGSATGDVLPLQVLIMFVRTVNAMDPEARATAVGQFLHRGAPTSFIVDIGLAAAIGEVDMAIEHLLATIRAGRPVKFSAENDGRGPPVATVTAGLFMPNCEVLRRDARFAEVCVRLGLYDFWVETGLWPDCVAELAPFYDLKAECARLVGKVEPYAAAVLP